MKAKTLLKKGINYLGKKAPTVLAGAAVAGVIVTAILAAKGHTKAHSIVQNEEKRRENEAYDNMPKSMFDECTQDEIEQYVKKQKKMTFSEKFKLTWLCYLAPSISGTLTIASIIASHSISQKRLAAMGILLSSAETALSKYENKVTDLFGKAKADKIKESLTDDYVPSHAPEDGATILTKHGDTLFFDKLTGRYFRSSMEYVLKQQNALNKDLIDGGDISLNEFYYMMDVDGCHLGDIVGFNPEVPLDIEFTSKTLDDGQQITIMNYPVHPKWEDRQRETLF